MSDPEEGYTTVDVEYVYACHKHADLRNEMTKADAAEHKTAYEQLDRPLLHVVQSGRYCTLINPGPSSIKCDGPIFRWKTTVLGAPGASPIDLKP